MQSGERWSLWGMDVNGDSMRRHTGDVTRLGCYAHGLVVRSMSWLFGEVSRQFLIFNFEF